MWWCNGPKDSVHPESESSLLPSCRIKLSVQGELGGQYQAGRLLKPCQSSHLSISYPLPWLDQTLVRPLPSHRPLNADSPSNFAFKQAWRCRAWSFQGLAEHREKHFLVNCPDSRIRLSPGPCPRARFPSKSLPSLIPFSIKEKTSSVCVSIYLFVWDACRWWDWSVLPIAVVFWNKASLTLVWIYFSLTVPMTGLPHLSSPATLLSHLRSYIL